MNITKTDYKTLKFEEKPVNIIKNYAILPLSVEGEKCYLGKSGPSNTYLYKPTVKMVQNLYDKKDGLNANNYANVFDDEENKQNEEEPLVNKDVEELPKEEDSNIENNIEIDGVNININGEGKLVSESKLDKQEVEKENKVKQQEPQVEKHKPFVNFNLKLDYEPTDPSASNTKTNFYKTGFF